MSDQLLSIEDMVVSFAGVRAVDGVSMSVCAGEIFGVVGPNGAGKTTLLNGISRLVPLTSGTVHLEDIDLTRHTAHQLVGMGIARTFQAAEAFQELSVADYLLLGRLATQSKSLVAAALRLPYLLREQRTDRAAAVDALSRYGLTDLADRRLGDLPYGIRKLIDVLRASLSRPRLYLLDEPTSGTASDDREALRRALREARDSGAAVVVIDHDIEFVSALCDRLLVMNFGKELAYGEPATVLVQPEVELAYTGLSRKPNEPVELVSSPGQEDSI